MRDCDNKLVIKSSRYFPVFTLIAGLLLVAKLTAYPEISWGVIIAIWTVPLMISIILLSLAVFVVGSAFVISLFFK